MDEFDRFQVRADDGEIFEILELRNRGISGAHGVSSLVTAKGERVCRLLEGIYLILLPYGLIRTRRIGARGLEAKLA